MDDTTEAPRRVSRCLPHADAWADCWRMAETLKRMRRPERVGVRKWGQGWAVFLFTPREESPADPPHPN